ncbi:MAG: hypothetical protein HYY16_16390 [Planctomycetes bacterium]|nr:hypothetical protein [Planctomycetota bacterium]
MRYAAFSATLALGGCFFPVYEEPSVRTERRIEVVDLLTRAEIEKLVKAGVSDAIILEKARKSGVVKLSVDDIVALKQAGASDELVKQLIAYERRSASGSRTGSSRSFARS